MKDTPLAVAIAAVIDGNNILLIERTRGDYVGLWGLPGGKVERMEHVSETAVREIYEETGIKCRFAEYLGFVSEHLVENGEITRHLLLNICRLEPISGQIKQTDEGRVKWFDMKEIERSRHLIIPSDIMMIEKMLRNKEKNYYDCILEKIDEKHILRKFE